MFQANVAQKINTNTLRSRSLFHISCRLEDNEETYDTAGQVTDDSKCTAQKI
jgi:hypothetical protein